MKSEAGFLSEIGTMISDALWSERELAKKEAILIKASEKIGKRLMKILPPDTPLMG